MGASGATRIGSLQRANCFSSHPERQPVRFGHRARYSADYRASDRPFVFPARGKESSVGQGLVESGFRRRRFVQARLVRRKTPARCTQEQRRRADRSQRKLHASRIQAQGTCSGFDFEDRFDLDGRAGWDLGKAQRAAGVETVSGLAVNFVEQIAASVDHEVLFVEFKCRVNAT